MRRMMMGLTVGIAAMLGAHRAAAQTTCTWTTDDLRNGTLSADAGLGWSDADWVTWYNRYHPRVCVATPPQPVSTPAPACEGNPYTNPDCFVRTNPTPRVENGWRFQIGHTYLHPYPAYNVTILGIVVNIDGESVFVGESRDHGLRQFPIGSNPQSFAYYEELSR